MMSEERITHARESSAPPHLVLTNDNLMTKILIRLHILCYHLFTSVSKQWIRILSSPVFNLNCSQISNIDPPAGLFLNHIRSSFKCDFVSLDSRIESRKSTVDNSFTLSSIEVVDHVKILKSCNGLLLCIVQSIRMIPSIGYKLRIGLHQERNFFESYGNMLPMLITIQIPQMLHLEWKLFECHLCLLLVRCDYSASREFTIYEMWKGCSVWSIGYLVNIDDFMTPLPEGWSIRSTD
ncbi:hypothetical protein Tco_1475652 [Tanacetum coccineum]